MACYAARGRNPFTEISPRKTNARVPHPLQSHRKGREVKSRDLSYNCSRQNRVILTLSVVERVSRIVRGPQSTDLPLCLLMFP